MIMHVKQWGVTLAALAGLFWMTACVNLDPRPDSTRFFVLGSDASAAAAGEGGSGFYVGRPEIPVYLKSEKMLYRTASGEVRPVGGHRWAEPLDQGIARALAEALAAQSGTASAGFYPWAKPAPETATLRLQVREFGGDGDGSIVFDAAWELQDPARSAPLRGDFRAQIEAWKVGSPDGLVAGMNELIARLALEIAAKTDAH